MMAHGIIIAIAVSLIWILLQNLLMHFRPAEDRFGAMLRGYALSLPLVFVAYQWLPPMSAVVADATQRESYAMGLFHAYFFHLLLFFLYAECFYHVERSVTLRFFVELLKRGEQGAKIDVIKTGYSVDDMIRQRLQVMRDQGFLEERPPGWHFRLKGLLLARISRLGSKLFQFKAQHERM
jgi:hypothetical protein